MLTVSELRAVFTADVSDFERGTQAVERGTRQTAAQISTIMRRAGDEGGQQFARGATSGVRGMDSRFAAEGVSAGRSFGAGAGRTAGSEMRSQIRRSIAALGIGTLAIQGFGKTITLAKDFDLTMRQVGVQTGQTGRQVDQLRQLALQMGADTTFSAKDAGDAMLELSKGGMTAAQVKAGALRAALLLAAAGQTSMGEAATYTVQGMTTFGLKATQAKQVAVALAGGALASTASVQSLGEALSQVGPGAKNAGMSLQETVGVLAAFDNAGIKGSDAGTSLKTMLSSLVPATDQAQKAADQFGLSFVDSKGNIDDVATVAQKLHDKLGPLSQEQRNVALSQIFGSDASRAAAVLMDLGRKGVEKYTRATKDQQAAQKLANAGMSGASGAFESLQGSVETVAIKVGDKLLPSLADGAKKLQGFVDDMSNGRGAGGDFADSLGTVADTVGTVAKGVGKVVGWWGKLPDSIQGAILKTAVYGGAISGVLVTAKKLADVVGLTRVGKIGTGLLTGKGGGLGGGASTGTMTVKAAVVNVYGEKGAGGGSGQQQRDVTRSVPNTGALNASKSTAVLATAIDLMNIVKKGQEQRGEKVWTPIAKNAAGAVAAGAAGASSPSDRRIKAVKDALYALPKEVATKITAPGAKPTMQDIMALGKQYRLTPAQVKTLMEATGVNDQRRQVGDYLKLLHLTPDQIATVLNADTTNGTGPLRAYLRSLNLTPDEVSTVVKALTSGANGNINGVLKRLGIVDHTRAVATASVRADLSGFYTVQAALNRLPSRVTTVAQVHNGSKGAFGMLHPTVARYALGGGDIPDGHLPEIAKGGAPFRMWAEPETGGEAYIPLRNDGRRPRAKDILAQVAGHFGGTVAYAQGGTTGGLASMSGLDFTKLTQAWLQAAQASMQTAAAAKATTQSQLDDVNGRKQVADLQRQLSARTNNAKQIGALVAALNDRDKKGRLEVTGHARAVKEAELRRLRASNGKYTLTGVDREAASLELQKAKEDLAALRASAAAAGLSDAGTAARDKALDRSGIFGTGAVTANQLLKNLQADAVTNQQFAGIVAQLGKSGLSKDLLDQFTKEGASSASLALGKSILSTGNIGALNAVQAAIGTQATQAGYQAQGVKAPGAAGNLVNIESYYEAGKSTDQIAEELWFKSQMRTG